METQEVRPGVGALTAGAFIAPWLLLSFALPAPWRWQGFALLGLLAFLLALAAGVAERIARRKGLDAQWWSFLAVVTFGYALPFLLRWPEGVGRGHATFVCGECARIGSVHEPFCFGCGA